MKRHALTPLSRISRGGYSHSPTFPHQRDSRQPSVYRTPSENRTATVGFHVTYYTKNRHTSQRKPLKYQGFEPISERLPEHIRRRLFYYPNTDTNPGAYSSVWSPCSAICAYYPRAGRYSKFNSQKREKTMRPRQHAPSPSSDRFFCCPRQRSAPSGITPFCRITTGVNSPPTKK